MPQRKGSFEQDLLTRSNFYYALRKFAIFFKDRHTTNIQIAALFSTRSYIKAYRFKIKLRLKDTNFDVNLAIGR